MSRVLCFAVQSVRHLSGCAVADTFYRSTLRRFSEENRTSRPPTSVYMNFQLPKCTACRVTTATGGLLPHLLTLTGVRCETLRRRLFSSARVRLHRRLPIKKRNALCCPDFPHRITRMRATNCPAVPFLPAKVGKKVHTRVSFAEFEYFRR